MVKKIAELLEAIIMIYRFCYESFSGVLSLEEYQKIKTVKYKMQVFCNHNQIQI